MGVLMWYRSKRIHEVQPHKYSLLSVPSCIVYNRLSYEIIFVDPSVSMKPFWFGNMIWFDWLQANKFVIIPTYSLVMMFPSNNRCQILKSACHFFFVYQDCFATGPCWLCSPLLEASVEYFCEYYAFWICSLELLIFYAVFPRCHVHHPVLSGHYFFWLYAVFQSWNLIGVCPILHFV